MKDITILRYGKGMLTSQDIIDLESRINVKLPPCYERFLLLHNGGHPDKDSYTYCDERKQGSDIASFLAFYKGNISSLITDINIYEDRIPKGFIPIAYDSGGNLICLGVEGEKYNMVYFWEHEEEADEGEEPTFDNMYLIANSFTDFINSLYKFDLDVNKDGEEIWAYTHDKYSISFSREAKKYGKLVLDFFANAPDKVEDYIIEEKEDCEDRLLYYNVPEEGKRYNRLIKGNGEVNDYVSDIEEPRENRRENEN